jgi:hypothetical protein
MNFVRGILLVGIFAAGFAFTRTLHGQVSGISVLAGRQVSTDRPQAPFAETFLAINPHDDKNMIATSMVVSDGVFHSWVYASRDGGHTWQRVQTGTFKGGDPVVYFNSNGTAFFGAILFGTPEGFLLSRSNDGGFTWQPPITLRAGDFDRGYLTFDDTGGKFNERMYAAGTIGLGTVNGTSQRAIDITFSTDNGRTFSPGILLTGNSAKEDFSVVSDPLVASGGELIVPYSTYPTELGSDSPVPEHLWTVVSRDGGLTFSPARAGPTCTRGTGFRAMQSYAPPRAAIDRSHGHFLDRIYLACADFDGKKYMVKASHSTDLGMTWSKPIVVNDNTNDGDAGIPAITVSKDGTLAVAWNDRRGDPKNSCYRLYYAVSLDGGETFLPNVRASEQPTCPAAPGNWALIAFSPHEVGYAGHVPTIGIRAAAERFPNGGDTQGLVAGNDGIFRSAWINGESGVMQLWFNEIAVQRAKAFQSPFINPRKDLSRDLTLEVSEPSIDFTTHTVSVTVSLINPRSVRFQGPFTVVLDNVEWSSLKDIHVINSDNGMPARGAAWNFTVRGETSLLPQQKSDARVFRWGFTGGPPEEPNDPLFFAHFIILGQPKQ